MVVKNAARRKALVDSIKVISILYTCAIIIVFFVLYVDHGQQQ